jgi:hypothetical protein
LNIQEISRFTVHAPCQPVKPFAQAFFVIASFGLLAPPFS